MRKEIQDFIGELSQSGRSQSGRQAGGIKSDKLIELIRNITLKIARNQSRRELYSELDGPTFSSISGKLEANFDFSQSPLKEFQNLSVILISVEEGEEIDNVQYKIIKLSLQNTQTVDF